MTKLVKIHVKNGKIDEWLSKSLELHVPMTKETKETKKRMGCRCWFGSEPTWVDLRVNSDNMLWYDVREKLSIEFRIPPFQLVFIPTLKLRERVDSSEFIVIRGNVFEQSHVFTIDDLHKIEKLLPVQLSKPTLIDPPRTWCKTYKEAEKFLLANKALHGFWENRNRRQFDRWLYTIKPNGDLYRYLCYCWQLYSISYGSCCCAASIICCPSKPN
jgi:hypothetical protein